MIFFRTKFWLNLLRLKVTLLLSFVAMLDLSCKDELKKYDVVYEVQFPKGNAVIISYNSDLYAATGKRNQIVYNSDSTNQYYSSTWYARHYAFEGEDYYIKVDYTKLQNADSNYKVAVYINDQLAAEKKGTISVELKGTI